VLRKGKGVTYLENEKAMLEKVGDPTEKIAAVGDRVHNMEGIRGKRSACRNQLAATR